MKFPPIMIPHPVQGSFVYCRSREITVWDSEKRQPVHSFKLERPVLDAALIPDSPLIALAGSGLELWNLESGEKVETLLSSSEGLIGRVVATSEGNHLGFLPFFPQKSFSIYGLQERAILRTFQGHYNEICALAASDKGRRLISAELGMIGMIAWDLATGIKIWEQQHRGHEFLLTPTPDDRSLISSRFPFGKTGLIIFSDLKTGQKLKEWKGHSADVTDFAVARANKFFVSCSEDKSLKLWDTENLELVSSFTADAPLRCCQVVNEDTMLIAGDASERLYFLRLDSSLQIAQF